MTSFSLDPTLWCPIGQLWTWVMADRQIQKTQSSKFWQLDVKRIRFQNRKKKRKWFFDHSTTLSLGGLHSHAHMIHHDNYSLQNCSFIHLKIFPFISTQNYLQKSRMFCFRKRVLSETEIVPNCMQVMYLKTWKQEFSRLSSRCLKRDKKQPQLKKSVFGIFYSSKKRSTHSHIAFLFTGFIQIPRRVSPAFSYGGPRSGCFYP